MRLIFRSHALRRMFQRGITADAVRAVVQCGTMIESRPDDQPRPSRLMLGWSDGRPLHVVVADDMLSGSSIVVTVYEPDPAHWQRGFRKRKR